MQVGPSLSLSSLMGSNSQTTVQPLTKSTQVGEQVLKEQSQQKSSEQEPKSPNVNGKGGSLDLLG